MATEQALIFYHGHCLDGHMSAYLLEKYYTQLSIVPTFVSIEYGKDEDAVKEVGGEYKFIDFADFMPTVAAVRYVQENLLSSTGLVTVYDHHTGSKKRFLDTEEFIKAFPNTEGYTFEVSLDSPLALVHSPSKQFICGASLVTQHLSLKLTEHESSLLSAIECWDTGAYGFTMWPVYRDAIIASFYLPYNQHTNADSDILWEQSNDSLQRRLKVAASYGLLKAEPKCLENTKAKLLEKSGGWVLQTELYKVVFTGYPPAYATLYSYIMRDTLEADILVFKEGKRVSFRGASHKGMICNKIARELGGGGHPGAAGVTHTTKLPDSDIIAAINEVSKYAQSS